MMMEFVYLQKMQDTSARVLFALVNNETARMLFVQSSAVNVGDDVESD